MKSGLPILVACYSSIAFAGGSESIKTTSDEGELRFVYESVQNPNGSSDTACLGHLLSPENQAGQATFEPWRVPCGGAQPLALETEYYVEPDPYFGKDSWVGYSKVQMGGKVLSLYAPGDLISEVLTGSSESEFMTGYYSQDEIKKNGHVELYLRDTKAGLHGVVNVYGKFIHDGAYDLHLIGCFMDSSLQSTLSEHEIIVVANPGKPEACAASVLLGEKEPAI